MHTPSTSNSLTQFDPHRAATVPPQLLRWRYGLLNLGLAAAVLTTGPVAAQIVCGLNLLTPQFGKISAVATTPATTSGPDAIGIICDNNGTTTINLPFTLTISAGTSGNAAMRQMQGPGTSRLSYNLYMDSSFRTIWPSAPTPATSFVLNLPAGTFQRASFPLYGMVPLPQPVVAGFYIDTLFLVITY